MSGTGPAEKDLAVNGGERVRKTPMPLRRLIGGDEKRAVVDLFDRAMESGEPIIYRGPEQEAYEGELSEWLGGGHVVGVNSGTSAVLAAVGGLRLEPYAEVVTPPITDPGGIMPVLFAGCVPVIADAHPGSYNAGAEEVEAVITERTGAVIVAHIGGEPVEMDPVLEVAEGHGLPVIEDVAQAPGALYKGKLVGTMGTVGCFSTMFGKHFCTGPQGGFVFTKDEDFYWQIRRFADRGKPFNTDSTTNVLLGLNLNLNDIAAAIGRVQLKKLPAMISRRRAIAEAVKDGIADLDGLSTGWVPQGAEPVYWWLRMELATDRFKADKPTFVEALRAEGIPVDPSYRHLPSEAAWFREKVTFGTSGYPWKSPLYGGDREARYDCPNAVAAVEAGFNVLIHENWGDEEVRDTVAALRKVWQAYAK